MAIRNIGRITVGEMREELKQGARFVTYEYVISLLVITRRRPSPVFYIRPGQSPAQFHWPYTFITLLLGWWGFPWGPALTLGAVRDNRRGGHNVTAKMLDLILAQADQQLKRSTPGH
ncbi:MAG TPA: hypothetical protein VJG32_18955 [Anaerolineae bacterium]|nr:hypothetical protein [Anaerolineae bacterium]